MIRAFSFDVGPVTKLNNAGNISLASNPEETELSPQLMPNEGFKINLSESSKILDDEEDSPAQVAIVVAICIAILILGIMVVVKVIG